MSEEQRKALQVKFQEAQKSQKAVKVPRLTAKEKAEELIRQVQKQGYAKPGQ